MEKIRKKRLKRAPKKKKKEIYVRVRANAVYLCIVNGLFERAKAQTGHRLLASVQFAYFSFLLLFIIIIWLLMLLLVVVLACYVCCSIMFIARLSLLIHSYINLSRSPRRIQLFSMALAA